MENDFSFTIIMLVFFTFNGFSGELDSLKRKTEIGFSINGAFAYRNLKSKGALYSLARNYTARREIGEQSKFGYGAELSIIQPIGRRFNLLTALQYRELGYQRKYADWSDPDGV
jgi:hypothetical protein